ncbi:peptidase M16 [Lampropedia cohaerens]|uniref:Peptidase M16 n=1 Tax=Lampropedia cohaerens TaxID=1610491 RepID=A0A0U1PWG8_9BURK|nr:pitrilysin family protein [Lampropedia cohaerens]KKW66777.1 peptidase M16 [Lampropedia cohaerens]
MKRLSTICTWLLACLLAACATPGGAAKDATVTPDPAVEILQESDTLAHYRLANGLEVIVKPDRRAPTAIHMLWVRVGSIDENDGTTGIAHVLEHMMFKGSEKLAAGEFSRRVAELGGRDNAFTNRDYTGYFQQVPSAQLGAVMALEADRLATNQWPDEEFTRELEVIKEERRMRTDDQPRAKLFEQLMATAYLASPERRPVIGWMDDIAAITADEVRAFHRQWYVPGNAAVVVVGNVEPRQVLALAQRHYGAIPAGAIPARKISREPLQQGPRHLVLRDRAEQAVLLMAYKVPALTNITNPSSSDREALALMALDGVLSGYDGARLERSLTRGIPRLADSAGSSATLSGRSGNGLFLLSAIPAAGRSTAEVQQALQQAIQDVATHGISQQELRRVITQWSAATIYGQDSMYAQASELGSNWILGWPLDATERTLALLREVTPAQVQAVARKYFGGSALTIAELQPDSGAAPTSGQSVPATSMDIQGATQ